MSELDALSSRAGALARRERYDEALAAYNEVLARAPGHLHALNEAAGIEARLGRMHAAVRRYDRGLRLAPRTPELYVNRGTALRALNRLDEALQSFLAATAIDPHRAEAHYNAGLVRLCRGEFKAGWNEYEWRWRKPDWAGSRRHFSAPLWLGRESLAGKTILLHAEQGLGDTIQFARYATLAARRGAKVILEVQPPLQQLLSCIAGTAEVIARGENLPDFDMHCPLLSLPLAFETELATVPAEIPYLRPSPALLMRWRERLSNDGRLRVGICWAGSPAHRNDHLRSIPIERFGAILTVPDIAFVSVQKGISEPQAAILRAHGVTALGNELADFSDTAAVLAMLDLVISVDTSIAHLAGAMGRAVGLLVPFAPDFRWMLDRTDTPWYPTMRLFRQPAVGDWDAPLARLRRELAALPRRTARPL